jgi:hypothetical protein
LKKIIILVRIVIEKNEKSIMKLSKTLEEIRKYTERNFELTKSHHFLFNLPLEKNTETADIIVIGLNPGEHSNDWNLSKVLTEETNEYDFHHELGNGRLSLSWSKKCIEYLPSKNIYQSEFFFWSSSNIDKHFFQRFGYTFKNCPHFQFCKKCNLDMINFHKPKLIVSAGTSYANLFASIYKMKHINTIKSEADKRKRRVIIHYEFESIPFIFTPHWSSGYISNEEKGEIISYLSKFI